MGCHGDDGAQQVDHVGITASRGWLQQRHVRGQPDVGQIHPPAKSVTSRVVVPSSRSPAAHEIRGSWRATASTIRCRRCCSAARADTAPAVAPAVADSAEAPAIVDELAPACPATAFEAARSTGETSAPPADGADDAEGATGAPDTGAVGTEGTAGAATTGAVDQSRKPAAVPRGQPSHQPPAQRVPPPARRSPRSARPAR